MEADEKSIITYISSLYDVFPEPPIIHPLYDTESQKKLEEYKRYANNLNSWIQEKTSLMHDKNFPSTLIELKKLSHESIKFKKEEIPSYFLEKQKLKIIFRELHNYFESVGKIELEEELHINKIEEHWNYLLQLHEARDHCINDTIKKYVCFSFQYNYNM